MSDIPIRIEWDEVSEADRYVVYVWPEGCDCAEVETVETSIVVGVPARKLTTILVASRNGDRQSINSEDMTVYVSRWIT